MHPAIQEMRKPRARGRLQWNQEKMRQRAEVKVQLAKG